MSDLAWREAIPRERARGAELVCLPHLSFAPYVAASRDRAGLEHAERPPSPSLREALALAEGATVAASAYESEGEGVFYVTGYVGETACGRQRRVAAEHGRYEQMFFSPGHEPPAVAALPIGPATTLLGDDLLDPDAWARAAAGGASVVIGGASAGPERWDRTRLLAAGMAAAHGLTVLVANRADEGFAGGGAAIGPGGVPLPIEDGMVEL